MTKKHFIKLAAAIKTIKDDDTRKEMASKIGQVCAEVNKYFNWQTWEGACNV